MNQENNLSERVNIKGFEVMPTGQLLTQYIDFDHSLGVAYERCVGYEKDFHTHDRLNLAFPRGASRISFSWADSSKEIVVDETSFLWMPAGIVHRLNAKSTMYDTLALYPDFSLLDLAVKRIQEMKMYTVDLPSRTTKGIRSRVLQELLDQYFFERILRRTRSDRLMEISLLILEEVIRNLEVKEQKVVMTDRSISHIDDTVVLKALQYIEANLFSPIQVPCIASFARTSVATLFRRFNDCLRIPPQEYIRRRRLDESIYLLKTRRYQIGDIALMVGYEDLASFSKAFKKQFQVAPSNYLKNHV